MSAQIQLSVDGAAVTVPAGATVAAAVARAGATTFRRGVLDGAPRGPLCGMGICFECRVRVDDKPHVRACMTVCEAGMEVRTDA